MAVYRVGKVWHVRFQKKPYGIIRRSSDSTRKADAVALEKKLREEVSRKVLLGKMPSDYRWEDAVTRWHDEGIQESWLPKINQLTPFFQGALLTDASKIAAEMKHDLLKQGLKPTTINRRLAAVRKVLNMAFSEWHWLDQPLAGKIKLLSEKGSSREFYLTTGEVKAIFDGMVPKRKSENVTLVKAALLLLVNTGMRKSELLRLQPEDWQSPNLIVRKSKNGKPRAVPVPELVHWICEDFLPLQATPNMLRYRWEQGRAVAGLAHIWMHDLRHTFASWYAENPEATMLHLRDILGHSNLAVTSRYAHVMANSLPTAKGLSLSL